MHGARGQEVEEDDPKENSQSSFPSIPVPSIPPCPPSHGREAHMEKELGRKGGRTERSTEDTQVQNETEQSWREREGIIVPLSHAVYVTYVRNRTSTCLSPVRSQRELENVNKGWLSL